MLIISIVLTIVMIGVDQLTKWWAVTILKPVGVMPGIPGVMQFRYIENDGAAFSFLAGKQLFLIIFTSIALLLVAYFVFVKKRTDKLEQIALVMVFAGGVGNLIDRIANGFVVDFFDLTFMNFAVFNVADCFVTGGFALFIIAVIKSEVKATKEKKAMASAEEANGED